jgi:Protein of unknown function (DUF3486)
MSVSSLEKLPPALLKDFDERWRSHAYGGIDEAAEWLKQSGHPKSRSAIGRYVVRLRRVNAEKGQHRALMRRSGKVSAKYAARVAEITLELAKLHLLQKALLDELSVINGQNIQK